MAIAALCTIGGISTAPRPTILKPNAPTESAASRVYPLSRRSAVRLPALSNTTPTFLKQT
jgi:hypothetical protein